MAENYPSIIPMLSYENGIASMEWLCNVFGFTEKSRMVDDKGTLLHGEIAMGEGVVMLATPSPQYRNFKHLRKLCPPVAENYNVSYIVNGVLVYVEDVIAHYEKARANGATILSEPESGGPGLRYRAEDPEGHRWMFMQK
jgi:uncharacterized glyoxalase superfamily protein PhnB